jgi:hypothetical protein
MLTFRRPNTLHTRVARHRMLSAIRPPELSHGTVKSCRIAETRLSLIRPVNVQHYGLIDCERFPASTRGREPTCRRDIREPSPSIRGSCGWVLSVTCGRQCESLRVRSAPRRLPKRSVRKPDEILQKAACPCLRNRRHLRRHRRFRHPLGAACVGRGFCNTGAAIHRAHSGSSHVAGCPVKRRQHHTGIIH